MPPNGLVTKGIPIPAPTTISAQITLIARRMYRETSYLSSNVPTISARKLAKKIAQTRGVWGRRKIPGRKIPRKRGMPPPRGIGLVWSIAGCLCMVGSSTSPSFLISGIQSGVAIAVVRKAARNETTIEKVIFIKRGK